MKCSGYAMFYSGGQMNKKIISSSRQVLEEEEEVTGMDVCLTFE
jgi:hypothetical protein